MRSSRSDFDTATMRWFALQTSLSRGLFNFLSVLLNSRCSGVSSSSSRNLAFAAY